MIPGLRARETPTACRHCGGEVRDDLSAQSGVQLCRYDATHNLPAGHFGRSNGVAFVSVTRISSARAEVGDSRAVTRLLDEVPEAQEIEEQLGRPFFARRWQQSPQRSFWITSDVRTAECLTLTGLDVD